MVTIGDAPAIDAAAAKIIRAYTAMHHFRQSDRQSTLPDPFRTDKQISMMQPSARQNDAQYLQLPAMADDFAQSHYFIASSTIVRIASRNIRRRPRRVDDPKPLRLLPGEREKPGANLVMKLQLFALEAILLWSVDSETAPAGEQCGPNQRQPDNRVARLNRGAYRRQQPC